MALLNIFWRKSRSHPYTICSEISSPSRIAGDSASQSMQTLLKSHPLCFPVQDSPTLVRTRIYPCLSLLFLTRLPFALFAGGLLPSSWSPQGIITWLEAKGLASESLICRTILERMIHIIVTLWSPQYNLNSLIPTLGCTTVLERFLQLSHVWCGYVRAESLAL